MSEENRDISEDLKEEEGDFTNASSSLDNQNEDGLKTFRNYKIPEEWQLVKLADLAHIQTGIQKGANKTGATISLPYLRVANVQDDFLDLTEIKEIEVPVDKVDRYLLKKGDVLMTEGGDFDKLGRGTIWNNEIDPCVHQNHIFAVRTDSEKLTPYFLNLLTSSEKGKQYFISCSKQSTNLASINTSQLKQFPVTLPPLPEQKAIANVLGLMDSTINQNNELIAQKELRKKWLMQNLLTGKKRLKGFGGEWKAYHLGDMFSERNETRYFDLPLLSIGANGVYPQSDSIKKDSSNEDKSKYRRICPGDIGYNTMRMWQGRSALSKLEGIVSPAYTIIVAKENADSLFFSYLFKTSKSTNLFWRKSQGLVDDTLNCKFKDFAIVKVDLPETKMEQIAIAQILQAADKEIQLLKAKTEKLREQKKGMMQLLLTGKKRLKI